jgi:hypothetical protein
VFYLVGFALPLSLGGMAPIDRIAKQDEKKSLFFRRSTGCSGASAWIHNADPADTRFARCKENAYQLGADPGRDAALETALVLVPYWRRRLKGYRKFFCGAS